MRSAFLYLTVVLAGLVTEAAAQTVTQPLPEEQTEEVVDAIRRYTVELIVFAYGDSVSSGTEIWTEDEPAIETVEPTIADRYSEELTFVIDELDDELTEVEVPDVGRRYMDPELVLFGEDDYTMTQIYDNLVELEAYEPLLRAGWTQPTYERELTGPIAIQTLADCPPWLDGSFTLYLGRYLHLVVDLTMDEDRPVIEETEEADDMDNESAAELTFEDSRIQNRFGPIDVYGELLSEPSIQYRIFEDRIVKNGDIRYFDHPKFGVIAKITRYEEPQEDEFIEEEFIDDTDDLLPGGQLGS